jgi:DNA-directed RNA polymerase specialized sigma24 family protein
VASRAHADATPPASTPPLAEQIATADEWRHWPRLREALGPITHLRELLYGERPADTEAERLKEFVRLAVYDLLVTGREDAPDFIVQARIREATSQRDALFDEIEKQLDEREPFMRGVARSSAFATGYRTFVDASSPASLAQLELEASGNAILEALPAHLRSVAVRIAVGREPKDIATELGKSVKSIRRYEEELRARLGAKSRAELVSRISSA